MSSFDQEPSTSRKRKRVPSKRNDLCGLTSVEYDQILSCLDSEDEPFVDSGSEYEPDSGDSDSDVEIPGNVFVDFEINENQSLEEKNDDRDDMDNNITDELARTTEVNNALQQNFSVKWEKRDFIPPIHAFDDKNSGAVLNNLPNPSKAIDYFLLFMNPEVVSTIITETNKYADSTAAIENRKKKHNQVDTNYRTRLF